MSVLATYLILLSGCDRNDLCYDHPHENLHVAVVGTPSPQSCRPRCPKAYAFPCMRCSKHVRNSPAANYTYYRDTYGGMLPCRTAYTTSCFSTVIPKGYNCAAWTICTRRKPIWMPVRVPLYSTRATTNRNIYYSAASNANLHTRSELLISEPDRFFATYSSVETVEAFDRNRSDTIYAYPCSRVLRVVLTVKVQGLEGAVSCRASLSGVARGIYLSTGECTDDTGTAIFDMGKQSGHFSEPRNQRFRAGPFAGWNSAGRAGTASRPVGVRDARPLCCQL